MILQALLVHKRLQAACIQVARTVMTVACGCRLHTRCFLGRVHEGDNANKASVLCWIRLHHALRRCTTLHMQGDAAYGPWIAMLQRI